MEEFARGPMLEAFGLLPPPMASWKARIMMLAIGLQESRFVHRKQIGGPAKGFFQFERGGGVKGVLNHPSSADHARQVCAARHVSATQTAVYDALEFDDVLAGAFCRLLLWTDPAPLPQIGEQDDAWLCYLRNWRPGKPHPDTWPALYQQAMDFVLTEGKSNS